MMIGCGFCCWDLLGLRVAVLVLFSSKSTLSESFEIGLNMGSLNMGKQRKMGFWESSRGVVGGISRNLVFS